MGSSPAGRTTPHTPSDQLAYRGAMSTVAFLGLGTMGAPMAGHLSRAGFTVRGWNRTAGRAVIAGVAQVASLRDAALGADVVVLSVSDTPDVEQVLLGPDGAAQHLAAGALVIDTSTISPSATRRIGEQLAARGVLMVDAPVSGGSEGAVNGSLTVFLGGTPVAVAKAQPYLASFAKTVTHLGPLGAGQVGKAVNQLVISGSYLSLAEGILVGQRAGLDPATLVGALAGGAARSWVLDNRWQRMADDRYPLGFKVALHRKDLGIAIDLAKELGVPVPAARLVAELEDALIASGSGDEDLSALASQLRRMADYIDG